MLKYIHDLIFNQHDMSKIKRISKNVFNYIYKYIYLLFISYISGLIVVVSLLLILPVIDVTANTKISNSSSGRDTNLKGNNQENLEYLHILSTGQSLSLGVNSIPALTTIQPYNNLMMNNGADQVSPPLVPLTELGSAKEWPNTESPSSGMANTLRNLDTQERSIAVTLHGHGGTNYLGLKKGTYYYNKGLTQAINVRSYVQNTLGGNYRPLAVTAIHGEKDYIDGTNDGGVSWAAYPAALAEWQNDYQNDISALIGQNINLPLFINQMNSAWTGQIATAQLASHKNNPGKVILVGPKYQMTYASDHLHLTNQDSKYTGELMAKVMDKVLFKGETWNPLMPTSTIRNGNEVIISYHIPVGQLSLDTSSVANRTNYGFSFTQTGGNSVSISSIQLIENNTKVKIILNQIPTGLNQKIRYAWGCNNTWFCGGASTGWYTGGNLRDNDTSVSNSPGSTNLPLYNWSVAFEENITSNPPVITSFTIPSVFQQKIPILSFTATDDQAVTGYLLTETSTIPSLNDPKWTATVPTVYYFTSEGKKTLYAWARDIDGNISQSVSREIKITNYGGRNPVIIN
jgi:hypothetical protein